MNTQNNNNSLLPRLDRLHATMHYLGHYQRVMPVSLERMFENALDHEHLPYLHKSSFYSLDLLKKTKDGWCASVHLQPSFARLKQTVCLTLDRSEQAWVSEVTAGFSKGVLIYTRAEELAVQQIRVDVDFFAGRGKFLNRFLGGALKRT